MPNKRPVERPGPHRIVYLLGAGATHAELKSLDADLVDEEAGLLVTNVSSRVIERARHRKAYLQGLETVSGVAGSLNIELLISLIESSKIRHWEDKTRLLKRLVREDIEGILRAATTRRFYLHRALLEYHMLPGTMQTETLVGLVTLNYDCVLDEAYRELIGPVNYCMSLDPAPVGQGNIPLLKLHGSFGWSRVKIRGRPRSVEIIPMGLSKTYLHPPYGFIWSRALEVLVGCDVLRVVGSSLGQNDSHLVDLLFKAHLERTAPLCIEVIDLEDACDRIRRAYGFFPIIRTPGEIGGVSTDNPFKAWLRDQCARVRPEELQRSRYLRRVLK